MALKTLPILLIIFLVFLPKTFPRNSRPSLSLPNNTGLSFSATVYHRRHHIHHPHASSTSGISPSEVQTSLSPSHEGLLVMIVGIGTDKDTQTPLLITELILDTGSALVWLQATPCKHCYDQRNIPYYDSSASTTYNLVRCDDWICSSIREADHECHDPRWDAEEPCSYVTRYVDGTNTTGIIGTETFYFENRSVEKVPFGLGFSNHLPSFDHESSPGIAGLALGHGTLLDALGAKKFSHCFPRNEDDYGIVGFGDEAKIIGEKVVLSEDSMFYVASLTNVYLSGKRIKMGFDLPTNMHFDTGSSGTRIDRRILHRIIAAIKSALGNKYIPHEWGGYELCYDLTSLCSVSMDEVAKITFEFGHTTKIDLFSLNLWVRDRDHNEMCLGLQRASPGGSNIFGNNLMREVNIGYSLEDNEFAMYFNRQHCAT